MHFVYHINEVVLAPHFIYREACSQRARCVQEYKSFTDVSLATRSSCSFWQIAHPLLRKMSRDASHDLQH